MLKLIQATRKRLSLLVDGESLFNDATAIVLFTVVLSAGESGAVVPMTVVQGGVVSVVVTLGGLGVGAIAAVLLARGIVVSGLVALWNTCSKLELIDWRHQTIMVWAEGCGARWLALPGRRHGSVLAHDRGMGHRARHSSRARTEA